MRVPPPFLIQLAGAIKPYDVLFIEEPAVPGNIEVFKRLKEAIKIPLAAGERDRTIWEFLPYLENRCLDILQPDVAHGGGITAMKKVATLAEAYFTPLAPHCTTTDLAVGQPAHDRLGAHVPDPRILSGHHGARPGEKGLERGQGRLRLAAAGAGVGRRDRRKGDGGALQESQEQMELAHPRPAGRRLDLGLLTRRVFSCHQFFRLPPYAWLNLLGCH